MKKVFLVVALAMLIVCGTCMVFLFKGEGTDNNAIGWAFGAVVSGGIGFGACMGYLSIKNTIQKRH